MATSKRSARVTGKQSAKRPGKARSRAREDEWKSAGTSFADGEAYFKRTLKEAGLEPDAAVFTSKTPAALRAMKNLQVKTVPEGFRKWQLPFASYEPTNLYLTVGRARAVVESHAHSHGAGFRVVISGSIVLDGQKLGPGDWFYVPNGKPYSYRVGAQGVQLLGGYECCCANWPCC